RHDEEVDDCRDDDERDQRIEELAVQKPALVDGEEEAGEIRLPSEGRNKRSDEVLDERVDHRAESHTYDHCDRKVDDVAAQEKRLETPEHVHPSSTVSTTLPNCWAASS